jgi:hypothetical protein
MVTIFAFFAQSSGKKVNIAIMLRPVRSSFVYLQLKHRFKPNLLLPVLKVVEIICFGSFLYNLYYFTEYHIRLLRFPLDALD